MAVYKKYCSLNSYGEGLAVEFVEISATRSSVSFNCTITDKIDRSHRRFNLIKD